MLKTTIQSLGDATIFRCEGQIVFPDADTLRIAVLTHSRIRLAVLDLSGINAIDAQVWEYSLPYAHGPDRLVRVSS